MAASRLLRCMMMPGKRQTLIMEAHNGLSARIAKNSNFSAIWGSGLTMTASHGVRDAGELTHCQMLRAAEEMVNAVGPGTPVILDGDEGGPNFNTARRFAQRVARAGVAGLVLEDKADNIKRNSLFQNDSRYTLADRHDFGLRLIACREAAGDDLFLVARTEALIAGEGVKEAVDRSVHYLQTGAIDAMLIHSKKTSFEETEAAMGSVRAKLPGACFLLVPTTYGATAGMARMQLAGAQGIIFANHSLRATIPTMQSLTSRIRNAEEPFEELSKMGNDLCSVNDVFALQRQSELDDDIKRFTK